MISFCVVIYDENGEACKNFYAFLTFIERSLSFYSEMWVDGNSRGSGYCKNELPIII